MATTLLERVETPLGMGAPFSSWPADGSLPAGYFPLSSSSRAAAFYKENGFVVATDAFSPAEIQTLSKETARLCRNEDGKVGGMEPQEKELSDDVAMMRVLCIHFPHKISDLFYRVMSHPALVEILTKVIGPNVKAMQSMLFMKASGKPGQAWHQDEDFIPTRDRSLIGAWIAFDDATIENGCLWVHPQSQQRGVLWPQKAHFDSRFDCTGESFNYPFDDAESVPVEVKAGSVVFFNGYLLHRSLPNRSEGKFRRSLVNHYMSAESLLPWKVDTTVGSALQDFRDIIMVAGEDPYSYKGTIDDMKPHVRYDGKGGCFNGSDEELKARERVAHLVATVKNGAPLMGAAPQTSEAAAQMGAAPAKMGEVPPQMGAAPAKMGAAPARMGG